MENNNKLVDIVIGHTKTACFYDDQEINKCSIDTVLQNDNVVDESKFRIGSTSNKDVLKVLNLRYKIDEMNKSKNKFISKQGEFVSDTEHLNHLCESIKGFTPDEIKRLPDEYIKNIFMVGEDEINIEAEFKNEKCKIEFMRDFLVFKKTSSDSIDSIDKAMEKLEIELKKDEEELDKTITDFSDVQTVIRGHLVNSINTASMEIVKNRYINALKYFDDALTLNIIFDHYKNQNTKNTIDDFRLRAGGIYKKFIKACKVLGIKSEIVVFSDLEVLFLPEKYHIYPNLFLFSIIKYFAYKKDDVDKKTDGVFLTQLIVNVQNLFVNKFKNADDRKLFIDSIMKVLDLFY